MIATSQVRVLIAVGVFEVGQPAARSSPSAASSASRSLSATSWCTRAGESPIAAARVRIEILSAQAETSARVRSRSACSSRYAARKTRASTLSVPPGRRDPLTDRHPASLPSTFRKLDAVTVLRPRLLAAALQRLAGEKHRSVQGAVAR